jgi:hypothetical protein
MSKLTSRQRNALPASDFGLPQDRAYPINDRSHAAAAKSRATQQHARGNLSTAQERQIDLRADRKLKSR